MSRFVVLRPLLLAMLCWLIAASPAMAGVVIGATRLVMHEREAQKDVHLRATGDGAYLVVSRVVDASARERGDIKAGEKGFHILPPIFVMKAGQERQLRIITDASHRLARDRETMLYLMVSFIPERNHEKNTVQIAVRTWIKLFYRPSALDGLEAPRLAVMREGGSMVIKNPSPFYISLSRVLLQGRQVVSPGDVPPFGEKRLLGCASAPSCELRWTQKTNDSRMMSHSVIR
ncbi:fimbrial biogenesis chaperone [Aeromonas hydrophila]|uniref:fimbrial biogenesis chaperone n=1 Tax=Aeromonas hydrophila TaxID=644 RepID=UPI0038CF9B26